MTDYNQQQPNSGFGPESANMDNFGRSPDTILSRKPRNIDGESALPSELSPEQRLRRMMREPSTFQGPDNNMERTITGHEKEQMEEEAAKRIAEKERAIARNLVETRRSDYISSADLSSLQSKYYVIDI